MIDAPGGPSATSAPRDVSLRSQLRAPGLLLAVMIGAGLLLLLASFGAAQMAGVPASMLTRDPSAVARQPFYVGLLSNLGVLLWAASGGVLVMGCAVRSRSGLDREFAFLAFFAAMTWLLAFDDLFMLHEEVYRRLLPGPELLVLSFHAALLATGLFVFRRTIRQSEWLPLAVSLFFFGGSLLADAWKTDALLLEDGAKFLGIVAWTYYAAAQTFRSLLKSC